MTSFFLSPRLLLRFKHARAFGYDMELNSRSLEDRWYPMWDHVLNQLIGDHPNLHIAPQYSLWYKGKETEESPSPSIVPPPSGPSNCPEKSSRYSTPHNDDIHPSLRTNKRQTETSRKARINSIGITAEALARAGEPYKERSTLAQIPALTVPEGVSSSSASSGPDAPTADIFVAPDTVPPSLPSDPKDGSDSAATVRLADAPSRRPDFVILHTRVVPAETAVLYGKYKATELDIPIIVEIKPYIRRHMVGEEKTTEIKSVIDTAREQILEQAGSLFLSSPDVTSVLGIATCGPYWSLRKICPEHISAKTWVKLKASSDYPYDPSNDPSSSSFRAAPLVRWSNTVEIEDSRSIKLLQKVQAALAVFSVDKTPLEAIVR